MTPNIAENIRLLLSNDKYINPSFTAEVLEAHFDQQFIEIFPNTLFVYDYNLIKSILKNPLFTTHEVGAGNYAKLINIFDKAKLELLGDVLFSDDQQHEKLKSVLLKAYMKMYEYIPELIATTVPEHFAVLAQVNASCISNDIATPISEKIFLALAGLGSVAEFSHFEVIFKSIRLLLNAIDNNFAEHTNDEIVENWEFVFSAIMQKFKNPNDSYPNLISALQSVTSINEEEKAIMVLAFIRAGIENPRSFIVSAIIRYFDHKNLYEQNNTQFLDEVMRYDAPAKITARYISQDVQIADKKLPEGSKIWLSFRLANFNPQAFAEPFVFKLRKPNQNLSLGYGPHFCIGKELTYKLTMQILNTIRDDNYKFDNFDARYQLDESEVFRRYIQPLYIRKEHL